jgi:predicted  nucleic acid-binding Zn-ribbon protein
MTITAATLRGLHHLQRQVTDLRERLERGPKQLNAGRANVQRLEKELQELKEIAKRRRMDVDAKELQLKEREGHILDIRAKLNRCSSNREYQAFVEQIAADEQANSVLSDEILELLEKVNEDAQANARAKIKVEEAKSELERLKLRVEGQRDTLETDLARLQEELRKAENALPADIRQDYDRVVKAHGEEALVPLEGECCGGCYQRITPQMINELTMSQLVFCKSCGRLLYIPEETSAE